MTPWFVADPEAVCAYLLGSCKDGTRSVRHNTVRIGQADVQWLERLQRMLAKLDVGSWIYREGSTRRFWVLETTASFLRDEQAPETIRPESALDYARGYFDADGGMPRDVNARLYLQFVQKDRDDLSRLREMLDGEGIRCGALHNPSRRADPNYWRFFIRASSHIDFMNRVGSWHPAKEGLIAARLGCSKQAGEAPHLALETR